MIAHKSTKQVLWIIFLTIFLDMLGLGILIPVFPMLVVPGSASRIIPATWSIGDGYIMLGWLMAIFPLCQFIFTPILGQLSDHYGRRRILIISICGTVFSYILFAIGIAYQNLPLLFIARAIDGISGGNISTAQAVIGDISPVANRAKNFGLIGVALGLGFVSGPFFGGKLSDPSICSWFDATTPFWFAAVMGIINVILVLTLLPETLPVKSTKRLDITRPIHNIIKAFSLPGISSVIPAIFLFNSGFAFFTTFWGVVLAEKFGFNQSGIGNFFAYTGIMIILGQGLVVRRLSGKVADYKVLYYSLILAGIPISLNYFIPSSHTVWLYYIPPFIALGASLTRAFSSALLTDIAPIQVRGEIMGINASAFALSQVLPSILAGYLAVANATLPILLGGILAILGGSLFIYAFKPSKCLPKSMVK